ncbi:hypothetical protein BH10PLA1_BH10PLA1_09670 [soil metagenome]
MTADETKLLDAIPTKETDFGQIVQASGLSKEAARTAALSLQNQGEIELEILSHKSGSTGKTDRVAILAARRL